MIGQPSPRDDGRDSPGSANSDPGWFLRRSADDSPARRRGVVLPLPPRGFPVSRGVFMSADPDAPGASRPVRIGGRYDVVKHIATGGMGAVYKAVDTETGRLVALKVLKQDLASRPNVLARFYQEAKSAAKLQHENIIAIYDFGED